MSLVSNYTSLRTSIASRKTGSDFQHDATIYGFILLKWFDPMWQGNFREPNRNSSIVNPNAFQRNILILNSQFIQRYYFFSFALCVIPSRLINRFIFFTDGISYQFHFLKKKSIAQNLDNEFSLFPHKISYFWPGTSLWFPNF